MSDFDGIIQSSPAWVDIPSLSNTALAVGGTAGAGVMNAQASALAQRTNYLYNYSVQYNISTGFVGIGTSSPTAKVDISDGTTARYKINPSTGSSRLSSRNSTDTAYTSIIHDATQHIWNISGTEAARVDTNLNFGLGTLSPVYLAGYKIMDVRGSSGSFYYGGDTTGVKAFRVGYKADSDTVELNAISNNGLQLKTFGISRIHIDNVGNTGINTTTTSGGTGNTTVEGKLIVYQPSSNVPAITVPFPGSNYAGFKLVHQTSNVGGGADYTDFRIRPSYSTGIASGGDVTFLRVINTHPRNYPNVNLAADGGYVGIGQVPSDWSVYKALEIGASGNALYSTSSELGMVSNAYWNTAWKVSANSISPTRYTHGNGQHAWYYSSTTTAGSTITWTEAMRIDGTSGNVGVKASSPAYTLDVGGTVRAQGDMRVTGNAIVTGTSTLASTLTVNSNIIANTSKGFNFGAQYKNLKLWASGTNLITNISADAIVLENSSNQDCIVLRGVLQQVSIGVSGAGGLDTGTSAISTWYSVWLIYNPTTSNVNTLLSTSTTSPTMPSGYTHKARVGWIKTDSTSNKYPLAFTQNNNKVQLKVGAGTNVTTLPAIFTGTTGNISTPTWTQFTVTGVNVPLTAISIKVIADAVNSTTMAAPNASHGAFSNVGNKPPIICSFVSSATGGMSTLGELVLESPYIYAASDGASNNLKVFGWEDSI